ncbi:MAG: hypothetical protein F2667_05890 [Actinobacteria bacterium]|uniref:Unannotated protein n=1 Tax=freshwater metagenome TaxID=449393 RepID=A0A6J6PYA1_9ZZZZ|nr:hypothetical protein [Actinomycetota bacterium]
MTTTLRTHRLSAAPLSESGFAAYGVVLRSMPDGTPFTEAEAQLDVSGGTPRFYVMHLEDKAPTFVGITRHLATTQTLMSTRGEEWLIAVAPPAAADDDRPPALKDIEAFVVPGNVAITMRKGTWHAGPFFTEPSVDFANLELSDTNVVDHHTYRLDREIGVQITIDLPSDLPGATS